MHRLIWNEKIYSHQLGKKEKKHLCTANFIFLVVLNERRVRKTERVWQEKHLFEVIDVVCWFPYTIFACFFSIFSFVYRNMCYYVVLFLFLFLFINVGRSLGFLSVDHAIFSLLFFLLFFFFYLFFKRCVRCSVADCLFGNVCVCTCKRRC